MDLSVEYLANGIRKIKLMGRLDTVGVEKIDIVLTALTAAVRARIIFDLTRVSLLTSAGIGVLLRSVNAVRTRGGEAVLLTSHPAVTGTLAATHIHKVVKIFGEVEPACKALLPEARSVPLRIAGP